MRIRTILIFLGVIMLSASLGASNRISFYHNNYGLINETLELDLQRGINDFRYSDVPQGIMDNSILLRPHRENDFRIDNQGFIRQLRGFSVILNRHRDKEIEVVMKDGNIVTGTLFFNDNELIGLQERRTNNRIFIRIAEVRNYILKGDDSLYEVLPSINWQLHAERAGKYQANLLYLASGFSWNGLYKAIWDDDTLHLEVLANLINNSGRSYENFNIELIAGEPRKVTTGNVRHAYAMNDMMMAGRGEMAMESASPPTFSVQELDEYYVYNYSEKINISHSEAKQIKLYEPVQLKPEVYYEYTTNSKSVQTKLKLKNEEKIGLGKPLPRGLVQIYRKQSDNNQLSFVGEDNVEQIPVNEEWIISPGIASDLIGETKILAIRRPSRNVTERDMEVTLRNRSKETKTIIVRHQIRGNWGILRHNFAYEQIDANTLEFRRELKPGDEIVITWTERIE